jgi:hypothetical protein
VLTCFHLLTDGLLNNGAAYFHEVALLTGRAFSFADCHLVAGLSIPSYTAAVMKWGFTKSQGITILVIATVALIVLMIVVFRATTVR